MKKLLVPCDFSKPAINAYRFALDIASQAKGSVHLIHVIELPVLHDTVLMPVLSYEEQLLHELREKTETQFNNLIAKYKKDDVHVTTEVVFGLTWKMIVDYADSHDIDLIAMGSHGASGLKEYIPGSNAEKVVRNARVPVLVLKNYYKGPVKDIVFPNTLDTEHQEDLVQKIKALQHFFKATLHLVWINTPAHFSSDTITQKRLDIFARRFMLKDYTVNIFNHFSEEEGILLFAQQVKADMIAMGTHSRKGLAHMISGSLAEDIVNHGDGLIWTYSLKNELIEA